jgi:archaemetzincin
MLGNWHSVLSWRLAAEVAVLSSLIGYAFFPERAPYEYPEIEAKLRPLAVKLGPPEPGEWLAEHPESGQSFAQYVASEPQRRTREQHKIYVCMVGEFSESQQRILTKPREFLGVYYDAPVIVRREIALSEIPDSAKRIQPGGDRRQILVNHLLYQVLRKERPDDALAYIAFVADDLWSRAQGGEDWSYVFGQASLRDRVGAWSLARFGDPSESDESYQRTLRLTLGTAVHETGHILSLPHCVEFVCCLNGANHLREAEKKPLVFCPTCYRKLCWNLQIDPVSQLKRLEKTCRETQLVQDAGLFRQSLDVLARRSPPETP